MFPIYQSKRSSGDFLEEEEVKFTVSEAVFYNPAMRLCRSMSSLAVGAIGEKLELVDAFTASGIRGIRYAKENKNVKTLTLLDIDRRAISLAKKNIKASKLKPRTASTALGNISRLAFELDADFLEIDPFGTPSPYLVDAFRFFNTKKKAYLSVTATDVAVLCGGKIAPCQKNYHSKPMNNEFTHETGLRIMLKRIAEVAAEFNMGIRPLVSFSDKHYLKSVIEVRRSADLAFEAMSALGHVFFCEKCGERGFGKFPPNSCPGCGADADFAGMLWLGQLHDYDFLERMGNLNAQREYADKGEIGRMLSLMETEIGMPPYYFNIHALCKLARTVSVPTLDAVLEKLSSSGYKAHRTHFSPISIKTDAPLTAVREAVAGAV
ncbi:tRNA (guanine(10)-N(2))-dimethyltransferase [Candidatus Micrarchaeota archaeon]|nr:tRNA (guanine(10)-N(2))-dimethyltransferase [Candidatus Micrarchaeota archaeon]